MMQCANDHKSSNRELHEKIIYSNTHILVSKVPCQNAGRKNMQEKSTELASMPNASAPEPVVLVRINAQVSEAEHLKLKLHAVKNKTTISELLRTFIGTLKD
jgi:hypothetical protein